MMKPASPAGTDADKLVRKYQQIGAAENHTFGVGLPGSKPPDFNIKLPAPGARETDAANPSAKLPSTANPVDATKTGAAASPRRPAAAPQQQPQRQ